VHNLFQQASQRFAQRVALSHPEGTLTYQDLQEKGATSRKNPVLEAKPIAFIEGQQTLAEYSQIWTCLASGKAFLPLNPAFPAARLENIQSAIESCTPEFLAQLAYIIFTSGSTGEPKGVPISSRQLGQYCTILQGILQPTEHDRVLQLGDFSFDISIMAMAIAWPHGASLYALPRQHILMAPRYAQEHEITIWLSVPSVVTLAAKAGLLKPNSLPHIRLAIFGGEALSYHTAKILSDAAPNARLFNFWGPTEGTISLSHFEIDRALLQSVQAPDPRLEIIPIGYPHPSVELALWNSDQSTFINPRDGLARDSSARDTSGELCASSPQITSGYLNTSDTQYSPFFEQDQKRWYHTGDLASWDERYGYCYQGRTDRQIKLKGYRIELQECEQALKKASGSDEVCVLPWRGQLHQRDSNDLPNNGFTELVGIITGTEIPYGNEAILLRTDDIKQALQELLPSYMIPNRIIFIDAFPLNLNGKVNHKALEELVSGNIP
jgi:D-alanine--poly(phosphoribitol) ligase subunit 1